MAGYFLKIFFPLFLCLVHTKVSVLGFNSSSHVKCIERERQALLNFKQSLRDYYGSLSTWTDDEKKRDCCKWEGIRCNNETGHVQMLDLSDNYLLGANPSQLGSLSHLRYLDLSHNYLSGKIPSQLGSLSYLRYLDLSYNSLYGAIPSQLGSLSHLRYLNLKGNLLLSGTLPFQVGNLPHLRSLRLSTGRFNLTIKDEKWLRSLSSLTTLGLHSFANLSFSRHWLQMISEHIPNLRELSLVDCRLSDYHISSLFSSHSNISTSLSILHLSHNMLTSSTFQLLSNYSLNLQELDLSYNNIVLSSPHYPNFPSLLFLDLSSNNLAPTSSMIFNFSTNLQELRLDNCNLTDKSFLVPTASIKDSTYFTTNLEVLTLDSNKLQGEILAALGNICTLQELYLSNNNLSGEISSFIQNSSWCNKAVFEILDLSSNRLIGMLPDLSIFTSLWKLDLSNNLLSGEIPKSIGLLHRLQHLYLEENYLEGDINELHLTNLSQLEILDLTDNSLSLKFATAWIPPFQLLRLGLASCKLGPNFPSWLQAHSHLNFLDISDAGIDDFVPVWFWNNLQSIRQLNMSHNSLKGIIPNLPIKFVGNGPLAIILNSNQFEGVIPTFLSHAGTLDLSQNKFSDLNIFLCGNRVTKMHTLDLSNNQITGPLPDCWEYLRSLEFLDIRNNKLSGKIPHSMRALFKLKALVLRNNNFIRELPVTLKNCSNLALLDLSDNLLSGPVPSWIGESMQQLKILSLRGNRFIGSVPVHLCYLSQIQVLDLSRNNLSGEIPNCLRNFTTLMEKRVISREIVRTRKISTRGYYFYIYDSYLLLTWKGQDTEFWNPEDRPRKSIDLSSNGLTGEVPKEVGYLRGLVSLNLSRNELHGEIPSEIGNLISLDSLDLSRNHLSGKIPSSLSKIDGLGKLDLTNNDLSGRIPWEGHLQTFDASSFEGNLGLCGQQLNKSCPGDDETIPKPQEAAIDGEDDKSIFYEALYMSLGLGFFAGFWGLLGPLLLWQSWRIAYVRLLNRMIDYIL